MDTNPDPDKFKFYIVNARKYIASYHGIRYSNTKKKEDYDKMVEQLEEILKVEPNDAYAKTNLQSLKKG